MSWVILALWIACAALAAFIARRKGRSPAVWAVLTLVLSPIVLGILAARPRLVPCPRCGCDVRADAEVCRHCSYELA